MSSKSLHKKEYGHGEPILCLHGLGANIFTWRYFINPFSRQNKLILIDLKGFGSSAKPEDQHYSIHDHADAIHELIVENDWRNLTLIGNSFGGTLALLLAIRLGKSDPSRVSKLVLIDAGAYQEYLPGYLKLMRTVVGKLMISLLPAKQSAKYVLNLSFYDRSRISSEQVDAYSGPLADPGTRDALLQTARLCIPDNAEELIKNYKTIKAPTLILWGRHDRIIPLKVGELLNEAIPNSVLEVLEGCGHIPQEEQPQKTVAIISKFLGIEESQ